MPATLITGANRGIGLEFVRQYLEAGWRVHACCRYPDLAEDLKKLDTDEVDLNIHAMDVTDQVQIDSVVEKLNRETIDLLINNAGIADNYGIGVMEGKDDPDLANYDFDLWAKVLEVNVLGQGRVTGAFAPNVARSRKRIIAMISSGLGSITNTEMGGRYAYRGSKAALNMLSRGVAAWLKEKKVIVITLAPGWTQTDLGGTAAPNTVETACGGMRLILDRITMAHTGTYWNYDGEQLPW